MQKLLQDLSVTAVAAGFLAVMVSYAGPLAIFFQAGAAAEISPEMMTSWVWAISLGAAISGIVLSIWLKAPVVTAWSAPGTALLVSLFPELSLNEAVGAYITAAVIIFVMMGSKLLRKDSKIPFGPYLAAGTLISLFTETPYGGNYILNWYYTTMF